MSRTESQVLESSVKIDLTRLFTVEDVRNLIRSVDDDRTWQLVITYRGMAYICDRDEVQHRMPPKIRDYPHGVELGDSRLREDIKEAAKRDERLLEDNSDLIYIRFESFCEGNGYVGREAAADDGFVNNVFNYLLENWPKPKHGFTYIDF